ncbi:MAG: cytochrome [Clostridiaceae bacterium]|jgi:predicted heme/steroid binding protein|nr:cytochrome [Clostridiaceae bacterium]
MISLAGENKLEQIKRTRSKIQYYRNIISSTTCPIKRQWLENQLIIELDHIIHSVDSYYRQAREITLQELSTYNGMGGRPAYVAVNGIVYDVSNEATWGGASHFGLMAGKDLTAQFNGCHGNTAVLSQLPKVGILK